MNSVDKKRRKTEEVEEKEVEKRFVKVFEVQNEIDQLEEKIEKEKLNIEIKYFHRKYKEMIVKRNNYAREISEFWAQVIVNNPDLQEKLGEFDVILLKKLVSVDLEMFTINKNGVRTLVSASGVVDQANISKYGYELVFVFLENEFFEGRELRKGIIYDVEDGFTKEITQSGIIWKKKEEKGKSPVVKSIGMKRKREDDEDDDEKGCFFSFFEKESEDDEVVFLMFKDELLTNPLLFFITPEEIATAQFQRNNK